MSKEYKLYKVLLPIGYGGRQEKGTVIQMDVESANAFGTDYVIEADKGEVATTTTDIEKAVEEMSLAELKAKAKEMKLVATGSKADLIERINLAQSGQ